MANNTLLSQQEIDALVAFLQTKSDTNIGQVLDQSSIDKLIELVKYNNEKGVFFTKGSSANLGNAEIIDPESDIAMEKDDCTLECETSSNGFLEVYCYNKKTDKKYHLSPACLDKGCYVHEDDSEWGYAISPKTFNKLANLFGISYTTDTYYFVCSTFAKVMYGRSDAHIAIIYCPPEDK